MGQVSLGRAADDHQLGAGNPGHGPEQRLERLALGQVGRGEHPRAAVPLRHRALGVKSSVSTPQGTTRIEERRTPRLARSAISAEWVATTAAALRPMAGSSLILAAEAPSACGS